MLTALEMIRNGRLTNGAIALFGKNARHHFRQLEVKAARFRGTTKHEFIDNKLLTGNLFEIYGKIQDFINIHVKIAGKFEEGSWSRRDIPDYPFLAIREAVINMLIHRDYYNTSGSMEIAIYDDRMEIWNIGTLPPGLSAKDLYEPHTSVLRNPLLAHAFFLRGDIEQWGRGTLEIIDLCKQAGVPKPEFREHCGGLRVRFGKAEKPQKIAARLNLNRTQQQILDYLKKHGAVSPRQIMAHLKISRRSVQRNIQGMKEVIVWKGKSPNDPHGKYSAQRGNVTATSQ